MVNIIAWGQPFGTRESMSEASNKSLCSFGALRRLLGVRFAPVISMLLHVPSPKRTFFCIDFPSCMESVVVKQRPFQRAHLVKFAILACDLRRGQCGCVLHQCIN